MGFMDFFRGGTKQSETNRSVLAGLPGAVFTQRDYASFVKDGYQANPYVYAAVRLRGLLFGSVQLEVKEMAADGSTRVIENHPLLDLLDRPNPRRGGSDFRSDHLIYKDLEGNAYIEKAGFLDRPEELYNLRPDKVQILVGDSENPVRGYKYGTNSPVTFEPERILHRKYLDPINDWYGQSPLEAGSQSIDLSNQGRAWNLGLLQNQAKPAGVLTAPTALADKTYNRLQKMINKRLSGGSNAGRPLLLEGGLTWAQQGLTPVELDWLEGQKLAAIESIIPLQVPPELIGISEAKTYGTFKEALRAVWVNGVLPELDSFMSDLNNWLTPGYGDNIKLCYSKQSIDVLAEDQKMIFDQNVQATWRTINEQREADGKVSLGSVGDVVLVPAAVVPLGTPVQTNMSKSIKAINIVHDDEKTVYWKTIDAAREEAIPGAERYAQSILDAEAKRVTDAVLSSTTIEGALTAGVGAVQASKEEWTQFFNDVYFEVGERFAQNVFDRVEKQAPLQLQRKGVFEDWKSWVRDYIGRVGLEKITMITDTSIFDVRQILYQGITDELSIPQISALIRDTLDDGNKIRATRIARTEIIAASNAGSQAGAAATGLNLVKTWLPTQDSRTRHGDNRGGFNHRAVVDGMQGIAMDQPYTVSNQKLMFPGDTSLGASAGNIINCRCSEIYDTVTVDGIERIDT